jgi:hypothetical protein
MDKGEFLSKLERLYPSRFNVKNEEIRAEIIREYADALTTPYRVDFDALWSIIRDEYDYATTPSTSYLKKHLPHCRLYEREITDLENAKSVWVKFPWLFPNVAYDFVVEKHQTEKHVLLDKLPNNWHWNSTLNKPERDEV